MHYILLGGAIFNFLCGVNVLVSFAKLSPSEKTTPPDNAVYRLFTAGTAFTFGAMYFYLFQNPQYAMPFLLFGMSLKFWVFFVASFVYSRYSLSLKDLIGYGVTNLAVGVLFAIYLLAA